MRSKEYTKDIVADIINGAWEETDKLHCADSATPRLTLAALLGEMSEEAEALGCYANGKRSPPLRKMVGWIARLWCAIAKSDDPYLVALATMAVCYYHKRLVVKILRKDFKKTVAAALKRNRCAVNAREKKTSNTEERYKKIIEYIENRKKKRGKYKNPSDTQIRKDAADKFKVSYRMVLNVVRNQRRATTSF